MNVKHGRLLVSGNRVRVEPKDQYDSAMRAVTPSPHSWDGQYAANMNDRLGLPPSIRSLMNYQGAMPHLYHQATGFSLPHPNPAEMVAASPRAHSMTDFPAAMMHPSAMYTAPVPYAYYPHGQHGISGAQSSQNMGSRDENLHYKVVSGGAGPSTNGQMPAQYLGPQQYQRTLSVSRSSHAPSTNNVQSTSSSMPIQQPMSHMPYHDGAYGYSQYPGTYYGYASQVPPANQCTWPPSSSPSKDGRSSSDANGVNGNTIDPLV
jgi:hypothetical protein